MSQPFHLLFVTYQYVNDEYYYCFHATNCYWTNCFAMNCHQTNNFHVMRNHSRNCLMNSKCFLTNYLYNYVTRSNYSANYCWTSMKEQKTNSAMT